MEQRPKSKSDKLVKAFTGGGIDLQNDAAVLSCLSDSGEAFSIVFPTKLVRRLIALGLAMSGALALDGETEAYALALKDFRMEPFTEGRTLLRLVLQSGIPLSLVLDGQDLPKLGEMIVSQLDLKEVARESKPN